MGNKSNHIICVDVSITHLIADVLYEMYHCIKCNDDADLDCMVSDIYHNSDDHFAGRCVLSLLQYLLFCLPIVGKAAKLPVSGGCDVLISSVYTDFICMHSDIPLLHFKCENIIYIFVGRANTILHMD